MRRRSAPEGGFSSAASGGSGDASSAASARGARSTAAIASTAATVGASPPRSPTPCASAPSAEANGLDDSATAPDSPENNPLVRAQAKDVFFGRACAQRSSGACTGHLQRTSIDAFHSTAQVQQDEAVRILSFPNRDDAIRVARETYKVRSSRGEQSLRAKRACGCRHL